MPRLEPGIHAPAFSLPQADGSGLLVPSTFPGASRVLVFFPAEHDAALAEALAKLQERLPDFAAQNAEVIGVSDAHPEALGQLARAQKIGFPLLSDANPPRAMAHRYGTVCTEGTVVPTIFLIDPTGLIRATYASSDVAPLPNPAIILRALSRLRSAPRASAPVKDDWIRGSADAPVILTEYSDYQCRSCADLHHVLQQILPAYTGEVALVHRHFPLRHSHPQAQLAAEAAEAAGAQGKYWEMHDRLFAAEQELGRERLIELASKIGLDLAQFVADLDSGRWADAVNGDAALGRADRIKSPPSLFINQILYEGPRSQDAIRARLDALLACYADEESAANMALSARGARAGRPSRGS